MNLMDLLQLVDARLRPLAVTDESTLQAVLEEVAAGPRPQGVAPDLEPRAVLAGQLVSIEQECRMLREHLHVELTVAAHVDVSVSGAGPGGTTPEPASSIEPD